MKNTDKFTNIDEFLKKKALFLIHNMYYHTFFANVRWTKSA